MGTRKVAKFCAYYDLIGDDAAAYGAFAEGWREGGGDEQAGAEDVFAELLSRC